MKVTAQYSVANLKKELYKQISSSIEACGKRALKLAEKFCPVVTGNLKKSLYLNMPTNYRFFIRSGAKYAKWVHNGRGPVRPVHKKCLKWGPKSKPIFAMYAGPAPANPFIRKAVDQAIDEYQTGLQRKRWIITENKN